MTNLPITTSTPQAVPSGKPAANTNEGDSSTQPFGEVLARQINGPAQRIAKPGDKAVIELAAQTVEGTSDIKAEDKPLPDAAAATATPADMLAALLPQVMPPVQTTPSASATTVPTEPGRDSKADATAVLPGNGRSGKPGVQTETAVSLQRPENTKGDQPVTTQPRAESAAPFSAAMSEIASRTSMKPEALSRDIAAAPAAPAPQTSASTMNLAQNIAPAAQLVQAAQLKVEAPVNQARWGDEFGQKITWLASSGADQTAELHLNPPQLGPLDVVIKVSGDQATALFTSPHAAVREAVEQAIPKLRDMMADNGIMLGNATVSDQTPRDQGRPEASRNTTDSNDASRDTAPAGTTTTARVSPIARHNGIVDTFA